MSEKTNSRRDPARGNELVSRETMLAWLRKHVTPKKEEQGFVAVRFHFEKKVSRVTRM